MKKMYSIPLKNAIGSLELEKDVLSGLTQTIAETIIFTHLGAIHELPLHPGIKPKLLKIPLNPP
ncbi:MAG: hypothetical protein ACYTXC_28550 [Nostoc sp.]